jgi:hypothetical protein
MSLKLRKGSKQQSRELCKARTKILLRRREQYIQHS